MRIDDNFLKQYDHVLVCAQNGTPKVISHNQDGDVIDYTDVDRDIAYMGQPMEIMQLIAEAITYMAKDYGADPLMVADDISGMVEAMCEDGNSEANQYN